MQHFGCNILDTVFKMQHFEYGIQDATFWMQCFGCNIMNVTICITFEAWGPLKLNKDNFSRVL